MSNKDRFKLCRYIDDGVYAGFDGAQIWIWTSNGVRESEAIALDEPTFEKLVTYLEDVKKAAARVGERIMEMREL